MPQIAKGAFVHPSAELDDDVIVQPYAYIGPKVKIGAGTVVGFGAVIERNTEIGKNNVISPYVIIGTPPQHVGYRGEETFVRIGDGNIIREFVTIHRGTVQGGGATTIGSENYIMAYCHIAHDCRVGSRCVLTSFSALAGHTEVHDGAIFGGFSGTHQYVRVGKLAMVAAATFVSRDVPPFVLVKGAQEPKPVGLNLVGLRRQGASEEDIKLLKKAYLILYSDKLLAEAIDELAKLAEESKSEYLDEFVQFVKSSQTSKRQLLR